MSDEALKALYDNAPSGQFTLGDIKIMAREMEKLQPGDTYVEIGVQGGRSLWIAKQLAKEGVNIIGIDIDPHTPSDPNVIFIQGNSREVYKTWDKGEIKLLFIDGDHSYEGVKADVENWYPLVSSPGTILFHDFRADITPVIRAVSEFADNHPQHLWEYYSIFSWLKPEDRYDDSWMAVLWK